MTLRMDHMEQRRLAVSGILLRHRQVKSREGEARFSLEIHHRHFDGIFSLTLCVSLMGTDRHQVGLLYASRRIV